MKKCFCLFLDDLLILGVWKFKYELFWEIIWWFFLWALIDTLLLAYEGQVVGKILEKFALKKLFFVDIENGWIYDNFQCQSRFYVTFVNYNGNFNYFF